MMDRWGAEALPLAGDYAGQVLEELLWKNGLHEGTLRVGGRQVELRNIEVPLLHVVAEYDPLVPPACAQPLVAGVGSSAELSAVLAT